MRRDPKEYESTTFVTRLNRNDWERQKRTDPGNGPKLFMKPKQTKFVKDVLDDEATTTVVRP